MLHHYTFAYDAASNMTSTSSNWKAAGSSHTDTAGFTAYDAKNELESVTHTNQPNESYLFDANGNRTNGGRSTGPNNELLSDGIYNYTYDGEGNLVKQVTILTGAVEDFFWDAHNQLIGVDFKASATATASETISYTNDFLGRRIRKTVTSGSPATTTYDYLIYDGQSQMPLLEAADSTPLSGTGSRAATHSFLNAGALDMVLADYQYNTSDGFGSGPIWELADQEGSVKDLLVLNTSSQWIEATHRDYSSFGVATVTNTYITNTTITAQQGYAGGFTDFDTGLIKFRARWYNPATSVWISADPAGLTYGVNQYEYVGNNPPTNVDSTGLFGNNIVGTSSPLVSSLLPGFIPITSSPLSALHESFAATPIMIPISDLLAASDAADVNRVPPFFAVTRTGDAMTDDFGTQYWKARLEVNGTRQSVFVNENDEVGEFAPQLHTQMGDPRHGMDAHFAPFVFTPYEIQPKLAYEHGGVASVSDIGGHQWDNLLRYDGQQDPGVAFEAIASDFLRMVAPESEPDRKVVFGDGKSMVMLRSGAPSNVAMLNQALFIFGFTGMPGGLEAPELKAAATEERILGGAYEDVRVSNETGQVNHSPAKSALPDVDPRDLPSFWMESADHALTPSYFNNPGAAPYRAVQKALVTAGRFMDAVQMDIDHAVTTWGTKYSQGIQQMLDYIEKSGINEFGEFPGVRE